MWVLGIELMSLSLVPSALTHWDYILYGCRPKRLSSQRWKLELKSGNTAIDFSMHKMKMLLKIVAFGICKSGSREGDVGLRNVGWVTTLSSPSHLNAVWKPARCYLRCVTARCIVSVFTTCADSHCSYIWSNAYNGQELHIYSFCCHNGKYILLLILFSRWES